MIARRYNPPPVHAMAEAGAVPAVAPPRRPYQRITPEEAAQIVRLRMRGMTHKEISYRLGIDQGGVCRTLRREGMARHGAR